MSATRDHLMATNGRGAWAVCHSPGYYLRLLALPDFKRSANECRRCLNWLAAKEEGRE